MAFNMHCGDIGIYYRCFIGVYALNLPINPFLGHTTPDGRRCAGDITYRIPPAYAGGLTLRSTVHSSMVAGPPTGAGHLTRVMNVCYFFMFIAHPMAIIRAITVNTISFNGSAKPITVWIVPIIIPTTTPKHARVAKTIFKSIALIITFISYYGVNIRTLFWGAKLFRCYFYLVLKVFYLLLDFIPILTKWVGV